MARSKKYRKSKKTKKKTENTKEIIKITDILGREVNTNKNQKVLIYIYDDGSIEKVFNN